jgi:hypothetical protein
MPGLAATRAANSALTSTRRCLSRPRCACRSTMAWPGCWPRIAIVQRFEPVPNRGARQGTERRTALAPEPMRPPAAATRSRSSEGHCGGVRAGCSLADSWITSKPPHSRANLPDHQTGRHLLRRSLRPGLGSEPEPRRDESWSGGAVVSGCRRVRFSLSASASHPEGHPSHVFGSDRCCCTSMRSLRSSSEIVRCSRTTLLTTRTRSTGTTRI